MYHHLSQASLLCALSVLQDAHACLYLLFWYCDRTHGIVLASSVPSWCLPGEYAELSFQDSIYGFASANRQRQEQVLIESMAVNKHQCSAETHCLRGVKESLCASRFPGCLKLVQTFTPYACWHICQSSLLTVCTSTLAQCMPAS